jgi:hypothetical protein
MDVDATRLACYDALFRNPSIDSGTAETAFGAEQVRERVPVAVDEPESIQQIEAAVVSLDKRPRGEWLIGLDNGQRWAQQEPQRIALKLGDRVTIRRKSLGSYVLTTEHGGVTRVKRAN